MQLISINQNNSTAIQKGRLVLLDKKLNVIKKGDRLFNSLLYSSGILRRLLRYGIYSSLRINEEELLISIKKGLYLINEKTLQVKKIKTSENFSKTLYLDKIQYNDFTYVIYSNYFSNINMLPVEIYIAPINDLNLFQRIYTFEEGEINHIHSCLQDPESGDLYFNLGDTGKNVGIWRLSLDTLKIYPVLTGKQEYRACVSWLYEGNLFFATDSPRDKNSITKVFLKESSYRTELISSTAGPVIYGFSNESYVFFSTSVEPDEETSFMKYFSPFYRLRGESFLYMFDMRKQKLFILDSSKKDALNPVIFGFGTYTFPIQSALNETLIASKTGLINTSNKEHVEIKIEANPFDS
tara:strand:- start:1677 stop:2735 length:1059 start_codon:yes stop_codon:yes gene_type:complete